MAFHVPANRSRQSSLPKRAEVVTLLVLLSLASYFQRTIISIAAPSLMREFSLSETQLGELYSSFLLGYALLMIPGGWLADRFGPYRVLGTVAILTGVFTVLTANSFAPIFPLMLAVRFLLGCCTSPLYPAAARMNANWMRPDQRAWVQGWIAAGAGIGGALSPLVVTWVILRAGWRWAFILTGTTTLVLAFAWFARMSDSPGQVLVGRSRPDWKRLLANRNLILLTASYAATCYFEYIFFFWIFYYLGEVRRAGASQSTLYTTALWIAWMLLSPVGGVASDRLVRRYGNKGGRRAVPLVCLPLSASLVYVAVGFSSISATGIALALAIGLAAATDGAYWASAIEVGGTDAGAAGGLMNTGGNVGGFLAPVITPLLALQFGWAAGLFFGCGVVITAAMLWLFIDLGTPSRASVKGV